MSSSSPPPKFQGGSAIIGPTSPQEWADFYRWLFAQWQQVQTVVSEQSVTLSSFPSVVSQRDTGAESIGLSAWPSPPPFTPGDLPPSSFPIPIRWVDDRPPAVDFPRYYVLPTIGPTIVDVVANIALYPASAYAHWLFLDSVTLLLRYSDGASWNPIPINTAMPGTYGDGNDAVVATVDANGRVSSLAVSQISYTTISNPLTGGTVTGSNAAGQELLEIEPAGTIATLTVNLEAVDALAVGTVKQLAFSQIVSGLTVAPSAAGGGAIDGGAITASIVDSSFAFKKIASKAWRRLY